MAWARIDDGFHDHPKIDELGLAAVGLWTLCLTWAHRHRRTALVPGHITEARVRKIAGKQADNLVQELVTSRLWEVEPHVGGWVIHDFADYLPKERDPDERRAAGRKGAASRWQDARQPDGKPDSKADGNLLADSMASDSSRASAPASPSRPVPSPTTQESGDRNETLRAIDATGHPPEPRPPRTADEPTCSKHPDGNLSGEPCAGCQRVREHRDRLAERHAEKARRELEAARNACDRCDGTWITDDAGRPTRRKCDHRRTA
jgi:hypothetical protein